MPLTSSPRYGVCPVNFYGTIRCCKAFLPILKRQAYTSSYKDARILNVVSMAGVATGNTGMSAYHASKFAAQSFSLCLRNEMAAFGIQVTTINPSYHATPMVNGMEEHAIEVWKQLPAEMRSEYGEGKYVLILIHRIFIY